MKKYELKNLIKEIIKEETKVPVDGTYTLAIGLAKNHKYIRVKIEDGNILKTVGKGKEVFGQYVKGRKEKNSEYKKLGLLTLKKFPLEVEQHTGFENRVYPKDYIEVNGVTYTFLGIFGYDSIIFEEITQPNKSDLNENVNNLVNGDDVEIIDKFSSHFGEIGKFDGIVDDIKGEKADRPYRVVLNVDGKDYIRFYRKMDIKNIKQPKKYPSATLTKITGYVGNKKAVAYVYKGKDSDLSHYEVDGKKLMGTVEFTKISKKENIKY